MLILKPPRNATSVSETCVSNNVGASRCRVTAVVLSLPARVTPDRGCCELLLLIDAVTGVTESSSRGTSPKQGGAASSGGAAGAAITAPSTAPSSPSGADGDADVAALSAEVAELRKLLATKEASVEAMVKQTASTTDAFARLMDENRSLKSQLRDFDLLMGDARKKAV